MIRTLQDPVPIPIPRDLQILNPDQRLGFKISGFGIPNPFGIVLNLAPIIILLLQRHKRYEFRNYVLNVTAIMWKKTQNNWVNGRVIRDLIQGPPGEFTLF
jgi:hypothetical protein